MNRTSSFYVCEVNFTTSQHTSPPSCHLLVPTPTLELKNFRLNAKGAWRSEWEAPVCGASKQAIAHNWIYWSGKNIRASCCRGSDFDSHPSCCRTLKLPAAGGSRTSFDDIFTCLLALLGQSQPTAHELLLRDLNSLAVTQLGTTHTHTLTHSTTGRHMSSQRQY